MVDLLCVCASDSNIHNQNKQHNKGGNEWLAGELWRGELKSYEIDAKILPVVDGQTHSELTRWQAAPNGPTGRIRQPATASVSIWKCSLACVLQFSIHRMRRGVWLTHPASASRMHKEKFHAWMTFIMSSSWNIYVLFENENSIHTERCQHYSRTHLRAYELHSFRFVFSSYLSLSQPYWLLLHPISRALHSFIQPMRAAFCNHRQNNTIIINEVEENPSFISKKLRRKIEISFSWLINAGHFHLSSLHKAIY